MSYIQMGREFFLRGIFIFFFRVVKKTKKKATKTFSLLSLLSCVYPHHTLTFLAFSESSGMSTSLICCHGKNHFFFFKVALGGVFFSISNDARI